MAHAVIRSDLVLKHKKERKRDKQTVTKRKQLKNATSNTNYKSTEWSGHVLHNAVNCAMAACGVFFFCSRIFHVTLLLKENCGNPPSHITHTHPSTLLQTSVLQHTHTLLWVPCPPLPSFSMKALSTHIDLRDASDADGESGAGEVLVGQGQALSVKRAAGIQRLLHCRPHQVCHAATACQAKVCV